MKSNKIQSLLINHLLKHGHIQLKLPDNVVLEIGITEEDRHGNIKKSNEYSVYGKFYGAFPSSM